MEILDFRDNLFPWIGLIVFCFFFFCSFTFGLCRTKKGLFWGFGSLIGYILGAVIFMFAGTAMTKMGLSYLPDEMGGMKLTDLKGTINPLVKSILSLVWFIAFTLIWYFILMLNYFIWYKRAVHIRKKDIRDNIAKKGYVYGKPKKRNFIQTLGMMIFSAICFLPNNAMISSITASATTSQHNLNKQTNFLGKFDEVVEFGAFLYPHDIRPVIDSVSAVTKITNSFDDIKDNMIDIFDLNIKDAEQVTDIKAWLEKVFVQNVNNQAEWNLKMLSPVGAFGKLIGDKTLSNLLAQVLYPNVYTKVLEKGIDIVLKDQGMGTAPFTVANFDNKVFPHKITSPTTADYASPKDFFEQLLNTDGAHPNGFPIDDFDGASITTSYFKIPEDCARINISQSLWNIICKTLNKTLFLDNNEDSLDLTKKFIAPLLFKECKSDDIKKSL
ncbi:MAG: hypothetical protein Ta2E_06500 [Mycoplasmoidaceae bacterium]|nr:MAG: hypothetical protein Ta2E_06500 [Mycoplasmoidaceae bacterium]